MLTRHFWLGGVRSQGEAHWTGVRLARCRWPGLGAGQADDSWRTQGPRPKAFAPCWVHPSESCCVARAEGGEVWSVDLTWGFCSAYSNNGFSLRHSLVRETMKSYRWIVRSLRSCSGLASRVLSLPRSPRFTSTVHRAVTGSAALELAGVRNKEAKTEILRLSRNRKQRAKHRF